MMAKSRFIQYIDKTVTLSLPTMSITGKLKEITPDFLVLETNVEKNAETVFIFIAQVLAMKIGQGETG